MTKGQEMRLVNIAATVRKEASEYTPLSVISQVNVIVFLSGQTRGSHIERKRRGEKRKKKKEKKRKRKENEKERQIRLLWESKSYHEETSFM